MKCGKHPNSDAVGQCESCGIGVCKSCLENTKELREPCGVLCLDCYNSNIVSALEYYNTQHKNKKKHLIIKIICYAVGLLMILIGSLSSTILLNILGFVMCGIYIGIAGWNAGKDTQEEYDKKHGATYYITDTGVHRDTGLGVKILMFAIFISFGLIATPISCIIDIFKLKDINEYRVMFANEAIRLSELE